MGIFSIIRFVFKSTCANVSGFLTQNTAGLFASLKVHLRFGYVLTNLSRFILNRYGYIEEECNLDPGQTKLADI